MLSENATLKTQAKAFSYFAFAGNLGIFIGPVIGRCLKLKEELVRNTNNCLKGGALSTPAKQYPSIFGGIWFFEEYPYALPNIIAGVVGLSAAVISSLFLKEVRRSV